MLVKSNFFFSKEECEEIALLCEKLGIKQLHKIDAYHKWDNLRVYDDNFKERILKRLESLQSELHKKVSNLANDMSPGQKEQLK